MRRLVPAAWLLVAVTLAVGVAVLLPADLAALGDVVAAHAVFAANVACAHQGGYFAAAAEARPLLHMWSLSVEEQFYVALPLLLVAARRMGVAVGVVVVVVFVASFVALVVVGLDDDGGYYALSTRAWELALGAALTSWRAPSSAARRVCGAVGVVLVVAVAGAPDGVVSVAVAVVVGAAAAALLIVAGAGAHREGSSGPAPTRALASRPFVAVGRVSYALYLWHWPLLAYARYTAAPGAVGGEVVALVVSVVCAVVSTAVVEAPFRRRRLLPDRRHLFVVAGLGAAALLGAGLWVGRDGLPWRARSWGVWTTPPPVARVEVSDDDAARGAFPALGAPSAPALSLVLWGDSHAMAIASVVDDVLRGRGARGAQATRPLTAPDVDTPFGRAVVAAVAAQRVDVVVLAARWTLYARSATFAAQLSSTIKALRAAGARVIVLEDVPHAGFDVPRVVVQTSKSGGDVGSLVVSAASVAADRAIVADAVDAARAAGAEVVDAAAFFAVGDHYVVVDGDDILYADGDHLSVAGARRLRPLFERVLAPR